MSTASVYCPLYYKKINVAIHSLRHIEPWFPVEGCLAKDSSRETSHCHYKVRFE